MLEDMAGAFMKKKDICVILELDSNDFSSELDKADSNVATRYNRGLLKSKYELQKKVVDLGKAGSSPAQALALKFLTDIDLENEG